MQFDEDGIAWSQETLQLGDEKVRLVKARGDTWVCCRCDERFEGEDWDEPEPAVPVMVFVGEGDECKECDLCAACFNELVSSGVLEVHHGE